MRIGIYDPYLDTLGGGEKYVLTAASCLSEGHKVELFWDDKNIIKEASEKLNLDLKNVEVVSNIFSPNKNLLKIVKKSKEYDRFLFVSDGSIPFLAAKKNILILQFPVNWVNGKSILNKIKLTKIDKIICYTTFVKKHLDKTFGKSADILYPPVDEIRSVESEKKNVILTVGRFTKAMNNKKQEILISAFKSLCSGGLKNWKLKLIGSYLPDDYDYVEKIKKSIIGYPIETIANASFTELSNSYKEAKIYWHAAGFGEDLNEHPEYAEHFGISTVEAMSAGAVPVVINAGGQKEIIENEKEGFLWDNLDQLQEKTKLLIENTSVWKDMSHLAKKRAKDFNRDKFCKELEELLK